MRPIPPKSQQNTGPEALVLDCRKVGELLPWWANGTLDSAEHAQIDRHLKGCDHCRIELHRTLEAARILSQHLPTAVLIDHALGSLSSNLETHLIQAHLSHCASCRAEHQIVAADLGQVESPLASVTSIDQVRATRKPPLELPEESTSEVGRFRGLEWLAAAACLTLAVLWTVPDRSQVSPPFEVADSQVQLTTAGDAPTTEISSLEFTKAGAVPLMPNGRGVLDGVFLDGFESAESLNWSTVISGHEQQLQSGTDKSDITKQRTLMNEET